jgi:hypothetical protein
MTYLQNDHIHMTQVEFNLANPVLMIMLVLTGPLVPIVLSIQETPVTGRYITRPWQYTRGERDRC